MMQGYISATNLKRNKNTDSKVIDIARKKALKSSCGYKISAIGLNKKLELVCSYTNKPRFYHKGGGIHAEMALMRKHPRSIKAIILCRVGLSGNFLPIHPCKACKEKANDLDIKIIPIIDINN